jgi:tetratricopeptide (TPR) repeat protein
MRGRSFVYYRQQLVRESISLAPLLRLALLVPCAALLVYGSYLSLRLSYADFLFHRNTTASVRRAVELDPRNGHYFAWFAELLENDGQDGTRALIQATRLNPMDSRVYIRLGLAAETAGDRARAERLLLHAASIDRLFEPRWALMNFYFRSGNESQFWRWAGEGFRISYGDRTPVFELCWRMRQNPDLVERAALDAGEPGLVQLIRFLVAKDRLNDAAALSRRIVASGRPEDLGTFNDVGARLIQAGDTPAALELWNALCRRSLLPFAPLDPLGGRFLTDWRFEHDPAGLAFHWRAGTAPGVAAGRMSAAGGYRFDFSGTEPDACDLITETVPLEQSRNYRVRLTYRTTGVSGASGLHLRACGEATPDLVSDDWTTVPLAFSSGATRAGTIAIDYRRPPGILRIEGRLELREIVLEPAP